MTWLGELTVYIDIFKLRPYICLYALIFTFKIISTHFYTPIFILKFILPEVWREADEAILFLFGGDHNLD